MTCPTVELLSMQGVLSFSFKVRKFFCLFLTGPSKVNSESKKHFDLLHEFDLTLEYGPCIGKTYLESGAGACKHQCVNLLEYTQVTVVHVVW